MYNKEDMSKTNFGSKRCERPVNRRGVSGKSSLVWELMACKHRELEQNADDLRSTAFLVAVHTRLNCFRIHWCSNVWVK